MADAPTNAFEAETEQMIAQLGSKSAAKRREAAYFLGEVASEDAVPALVAVYEKDKETSVRAAAAYSLGMYKAVERALNRGEEDRVVELLRQIGEEGKLGRRTSNGGMIKFAVALVVSLILMAGLYIFRTDVQGLVFGSDKSHAEVIGSVRDSYTMIRNDTRTLQGELLNVISNRQLSCIAYFNNPAPYELDPVDARTYSDAAQITAELNSAYESLTAAKAHYDAACNNGVEFGAEQAQETFQMLLPALQTLDPIELELTQAEAQSAPANTPVSAPAATTIPPTNAPSVLPSTESNAAAVTAEASAPPTTFALQSDLQLSPTIDPTIRAQANPKQYLSALRNIIDTVSDPRGASSLLVQYWMDVQQTGTTGGCSLTSPPTIPTNNIFIPESSLLVSPDLNRAVQLINSGLASLNDGWTKFQFACNSRTLQSEVESRLRDARVAQSAFEAASVLLDQVEAAN